MAWEHLSITKPHLVYIILGGFTSLFMLCSSIIKERMYIGEATVATLCGLIFGPHAANLIDPQSWGSVDIVTIEFSRIVLVVQCFAVGVELPKFYMERHWKSVVFLLVPVMAFGWLITSLFVWWMVPPLNWLESLVIAACITATDPVLASSVVGKGKFAKRVPKHLRDLLSAESGCNDGMAFPFVYLSLYLLQYDLDASHVTLHWIVYTILYECVFGAFYGFMIGFIARHGIKFAEKRDLIDRESFLVFYFVLALFCAGSGSILGVDDLLVGFAAGVGFSNDGWFGNKTEESHVSNVIDLLLNLTYFVYLGTIIPWDQFNNADLGLSAWRLTVIAIFVILFRRIPIMMCLKPVIPDVKTWREALFAGHFGPIGVGAIFVAILARAELESEEPVPLSELPPSHVPHYTLIALVWPIVTFIVIASIIVHGSSIAVFTLGKRINTLTLTMSYTQAPEDGPSWMNRLPRISSQSRSQARTMSDTSVDDMKMPDFPPGTLPPTGTAGNFLRRQKEEESSSRAGSRASSRAGRRRRRKWDDGIGPGGPISQSAIFPTRRESLMSPTSEVSNGEMESEKPSPDEQENTSGTLTQGGSPTRRDTGKEKSSSPEESPSPRGGSPRAPEQRVSPVELYDEGDHIVIENEDGDVIAVEPTGSHRDPGETLPTVEPSKAQQGAEAQGWGYNAWKTRFTHWRDEEKHKRKDKQQDDRRHEPARAYQFGNTIIVEDEAGEVVKKYDLPTQRADGQSQAILNTSLKYMGMGALAKKPEQQQQQQQQQQQLQQEEQHQKTEAGPSSGAPTEPKKGGWAGIIRPSMGADARKKSVVEEKQAEDDRHIRFTIGGVGQRMTKADFIKEMQKLDPKTRNRIVAQSDAPGAVKAAATMERAEADNQVRPSKTVPSTLAAGHGKETDSAKAGNDRPPRANQSKTPSPTTLPGRGRSVSNLNLADEPSNEVAETAVEKRRRMAALAGMASEEGEEHETPAERRRREAALGMTADSDSEDDDTERIPPARRGIRFADVPGKAEQ